MLDVPREDVLKRWDELPDSLREAMFSDENADFLDNLCLVYKLGPRASSDLFTIISNVLHGFIRPSDFAKEIAGGLGLDPNISNRIASEVDAKIFAPIMADLETAYRPVGAPTPTTTPSGVGTVEPAQAATIKPKEDILLKPSVTETPFILHQHEEETKPQVEAAPVATSPLRPMFYKAPTTPPPVEEKALESRPIAARLELGVEVQPVQESAPKISRTPREEIRQVNYSELRTPLDNPFSGTPKPQENKKEDKQPAKKPSVPDTNVVNLKDLPL